MTPAEAPNTAPPSAGITELVSGIVSDAQTLFKQQIAMLRSEFKEDFRRSKEAAQYMGLGAAVALLGGLFLAISAVHLLKYLVPSLPEWSCWAIVGGVLVVGGGVAVYAGKRLFDSFNPLPDKSVQAAQENLTWIATNPQS